MGIMAKLPDEIITTVFTLQRQLLERMDEATATVFVMLAEYGETEATVHELDELQSIRERADTYYSRFYVTLRRIYESQPVASRDSLDIVARSINEAQAVADATLASVQEIKRNWNLP